MDDSLNKESPASTGLSHRADARIRTGDPFITSEVLYQLSYVGAATIVARRKRRPPVAADGGSSYPPNRVSEYAIPSISLLVKAMLRVFWTQ